MSGASNLTFVATGGSGTVVAGAGSPHKGQQEDQGHKGQVTRRQYDRGAAGRPKGSKDLIFAGNSQLTYVGGSGSATIIGGTGPNEIHGGSGQEFNRRTRRSFLIKVEWHRLKD